MSTTIKDIAREMGISVSSVSKALNGKSDISEAMKLKIRKKAAELGYKKNMLAARLVKMKSSTIGVFIFSRTKIKNTDSTAFFYVNTMLDAIKSRGYDIVLFSIESNTSQTKTYLDLCAERHVEGAVFIGFEKDDPQIEELKHTPLPVLMIEKMASGENMSCITVDNKKGIQLGMRYLFDLGHTKIAFIKGHFAAEVSHIRYETYLREMSENNLSTEGLIFEGDFTLDGGYKIGKEISLRGSLPSAIFAANDLMAIGIMRAFYEHGIMVPKNVSIIGYDNFEITKYTQPRLTTISQNFHELAIKGIELLFDMIEQHIRPRDVYLEPELIVRESCARFELRGDL